MTALTSQEVAALTAAAIGLTGKTAARRYGTTDRTLRRAQGRAARKLGANSLVHAVALAVAYGWVDPAHLYAKTLPDCDWRRRAVAGLRSPTGRSARLKSAARVGSTPTGGTP